jgi:putative ABC transport system permease protein
MNRLTLALSSLWSRRLSVGLTVAGIALSTMLILAVERVRLETRENFTRTLAGTDLIVGARTSPVQLLLYSVFRIGDATSNIRYDSFEKIARHPMVDWAVPVVLGDSHRGFRVVGTTPAFFEHLNYGGERLRFADGRAFEGVLEAVVGAEVAASLDYDLDSAITLAHGTRDDGLARHETLPFAVVGILERTGSPADRAVHVDLTAIEAIHVGWESGTRIAEQELTTDEVHDHELEPETLTAFYLGLKRRSDALQFQRAVNGFPDEPLLAILPGVALNELWGLFSTAEAALVGIAALAVVTGLIGMVIGIFAALNERRREMAVLRAVGARPGDVFMLFVLEAALIGATGAAAGFALLTGALWLANPILVSEFGLSFSAGLPASGELGLMGLVMVLACATGAVPAWRAYRLSLQDGLNAGY